MATDEFGQIESRGIDQVPLTERHGKPSELFLVWAAANVNFLYVVLGGLLMVFGLNVWQGLAVVVVGNLWWAAIGLLAISGPAAGTPSSVVTRSMFGIRGNRFYTAVFSWPTFIAYEAINLCLGALAGFALADHLGVAPNRPVQVVVVVLTAGLTLAISVYGHATILRMSGLFSALLVVAMTVLGLSVLVETDWGYTSSAGLSGGALWATMAAGVTVIASSPLSWGISADYARYLPPTASKTAVASFTALGGFVPAVLLGSVGVLAGSVIDMEDPQTTLEAILPGWFYPVFLLMIVLGCVTNNILTMYSSGLTLQAIGFSLKRSVGVLIDGVMGVVLACYALFVSDFTSTLSSKLEMSVALLGPAITIYAADIVMRRNRYDGAELHDETPAGRYWYTGGVNWAGFVALLVGTAAAALWLNTTDYVGPLASRFEGADLSSIVGPLVALVLYTGLTRVLYPNGGQPTWHATEPSSVPTSPSSVSTDATGPTPRRTTVPMS